MQIKSENKEVNCVFLFTLCQSILKKFKTNVEKLNSHAYIEN